MEKNGSVFSFFPAAGGFETEVPNISYLAGKTIERVFYNHSVIADIVLRRPTECLTTLERAPLLLKQVGAQLTGDSNLLQLERCKRINSLGTSAKRNADPAIVKNTDHIEAQYLLYGMKSRTSIDRKGNVNNVYVIIPTRWRWDLN